ncbi:MAG TPA: RNA-binding protein [Saprospiraceae bacterium]|nr:RNA-binding protein [Saprospiraceae bacterium]
MNLYVSNLSFGVEDQDLKTLFDAYGTVTSCKVIKDRDTGRSRGFGFVEMSNKEEGLKAISELNNSEFEGKNISVNEARPKPDRPQNRFGGGGNRGGGGYNSGGGGYNRDRGNKSW